MEGAASRRAAAACLEPVLAALSDELAPDFPVTLRAELDVIDGGRRLRRLRLRVAAWLAGQLVAFLAARATRRRWGRTFRSTRTS